MLDRFTGTIVGSLNGNTFTYRDGTINYFGKFGQDSLQAHFINDSGIISGTYMDANAMFNRGFVYQNGVFRDITLAGSGTDINGMNEAGDVVGYSLGVDGNPRGFLYKNGATIDLTALVTLPNDTLWSANAINDQGQIVVSGRGGRAYILTPNAASVPESATYSVFGSLVLLGLVLMRRAKNNASPAKS